MINIAQRTNKNATQWALSQILIFLIFENQNFIKFTQTRNYKNTKFLYTEEWDDSNFIFFKKHTECSPLTALDITGYQTNKRVFLNIEKLLNPGVFLLYHFYNNKYNEYQTIIQNTETPRQGLSQLWRGLEFTEREVSETLGVVFKSKKDNRRLLLDYNNYTAPLKKDYSMENSIDLRYTKILDKPAIVKTNLTNL